MMRMIDKDKAGFTRKRIIETCRQLFYQSGYNKVTMEEVAKKLGISKKTLYRHFDSKGTIMKEISQSFSDELGAGVEDIVSDPNLEYPVKLRRMLNFVALKLSGINHHLMEDLHNNLPDVWQELNRFIMDGAFKRFSRLIKEGLDKGMINDKVNPGMIVALYACAIQYLLDPDFIDQLPPDMAGGMPKNPSVIFDNLIKIIYEGILTDEAKKIFYINE